MPERTLVLSPRYDSDSRRIRSAALQAGWHVERLGNWQVPERLCSRNVVLYGEPLYMEVIATKLSLALLDAPFDWLLHLPMHYCKRTITLTTLGEARKHTRPAFVKPADGYKGFEGKVYRSGSHLPSAVVKPDATPIFVVEPVVWEIEFRCFILEREITTLSPYIREGEIVLTSEGTWQASAAEYEQARAFVNTLLADDQVMLPPAIVLDVGKIRDQGWAFIEANAAWGAGMYGCDPVRVLPVIARGCIKRAELAEQDRVWVVKPGKREAGN